MDKKKTYLIIGAIALVAIIAIILCLPKKQNVPVNDNPSDSSVIDATDEELKYSGVYGAKVTGKYDTFEFILYLRKNGTFRQVINKENTRNIVGTYSILGNAINLETMAIYDSNGCYFKPGSRLNGDLFTTSALIINKDNTINIIYEEDQFDVVKGYAEEENADSLNLYSVNPTDSSMYTDCSDKDKV